MGRTIPSFRIALAIEKKEWRPFRNSLAKSELKLFDEMFDIPRLYLSACSNSVQLVPLHPIIMSFLFHHYKELKECIKEVEEMMETKTNNSIMMEQEKLQETRKEEEEEIPITLDGFL